MWMLLEPGVHRPIAAKPATTVRRDRGDATDRAPRNRAEAARLSLFALLGAAAESSQASAGGAPVGVFLHPGRAPVGSVSLDRVFDQFECASPQVYASIDAAELCHDGQVGFLLEVNRPFTDPRGARHERGVLFARSVRS